MEDGKCTGGWLSDLGSQWKLGERRLYSLQRSLSKFPAEFNWLGIFSAGIFLPIHQDSWDHWAV
jgi:hypothetical protein